MRQSDKEKTKSIQNAYRSMTRQAGSIQEAYRSKTRQTKHTGSIQKAYGKNT